MAKLIIVRNGQTQLEARGIWEGTMHAELTDQGRYDARQAAALLAPTVIHAAFVSQQMQTHLTADVILRRQNSEAEIAPTRALNDRDLGIYTGHHETELQLALSKREMELTRHGWDYEVPGGETLRHIHDRRITPFHRFVRRLLLQEFEEPDPTALVVTHQDAMRAYVKMLDEISDREIQGVEFASAEVRSYALTLTGLAYLLDDPADA